MRRERLEYQHRTCTSTIRSSRGSELSYDRNEVNILLSSATKICAVTESAGFKWGRARRQH